MVKKEVHTGFVFTWITCLLFLGGLSLVEAQTCAVPRVFFFDTNSALNMRVKDPYVVRFGDHYWMYYSTWINSSNITVGVATSDNLLDWKHCAFLPLVGQSEATGIAAPGAIVSGGKIHLFYQSYGGTNVSAILHAWSSDGTNFIRDPSNPIFHPVGAWNNSRAIDAEVKVIGTNLFLYSATRDSLGLTQEITLATAPLEGDWSRSNWTQVSVSGPVIAPKIPTARDAAVGLSSADLKWEGECIEAPTIATHGGYYYLFYAGGYNNYPQQIGVAVSQDGINFARMFGGKPILARGALGTWNHSESGHPGIFQAEDGRDYLFFQGDNAKIGLDWHISMIPLKWQSGANGNPDVPVLDVARFSSTALHKVFQAENFSERWMHGGGWPCEVIADEGAAGGFALQCVYGTAGTVPATNSPETKYCVNFDERGAYDLYARISVTEASQSFFVASQLNSTTSYCYVGNLAYVAPSTNYFWINVSRGVAVDNERSFNNSPNGEARRTQLGRFAVTTPGTNMLSIRGRDAGVKWDAFVFDKRSRLTSQSLNDLIAKEIPTPDTR